MEMITKVYQDDAMDIYQWEHLVGDYNFPYLYDREYNDELLEVGSVAEQTGTEPVLKLERFELEDDFLNKVTWPNLFPVFCEILTSASSTILEALAIVGITIGE